MVSMQGRLHGLSPAVAGLKTYAPGVPGTRAISDSGSYLTRATGDVFSPQFCFETHRLIAAHTHAGSPG